MIKLVVEDYCEECANFEPMAVTNVVMCDGGEDQKITQVCCRQREMCARLVRRYKGQKVDEEGRPHPSPAATPSPEGKALVNVYYTREPVEVR